MPDVYPAWLDAPILCCLRAAAGMEEELAALRAEEREIMAAQPPTPARAPGADTVRLPRGCIPALGTAEEEQVREHPPLPTRVDVTPESRLVRSLSCLFGDAARQAPFERPRRLI